MVLLIVRSKVQHIDPLLKLIRGLAPDVRNKFVGRKTSASVSDICESNSVYFKVSLNVHKRLAGRQRQVDVMESKKAAAAVYS